MFVRNTAILADIFGMRINYIGFIRAVNQEL